MFLSQNGDLKRCHFAYTCASDSEASHKSWDSPSDLGAPNSKFQVIYAKKKSGDGKDFMLMTTPEHPAFVV